MGESAAPAFVPGLEGVVAAHTRMSHVDGQAGELVIAGFRVEDLASDASFEETVHLLWNDALPRSDELAAITGALVARRSLPEATIHLLRAAAVQKIPVMDALRMAASTFSLRSPSETTDPDPRRDALALVARFPTVVTAYWRMRNGEGLSSLVPTSAMPPTISTCWPARCPAPNVCEG